MGWFSYNIYGGDDTQTQHYTFLEKAGIKIDNYDQDILSLRKTKIPQECLAKFIANLPKVKKFVGEFRLSLSEDKLIEHQMLAALLNDNNIVDKQVYKNAMLATEILMGDHCESFSEPSKRRRVLKAFIARLSKKN